MTKEKDKKSKERKIIKKDFSFTLEIVKSEYEATFEKARNIDNRINLLLTITLAVLTALLSILDFAVLQFNNMGRISFYYILLYLTSIFLCALLLVLILICLNLRNYAFFNTEMFDIKFFVEILKSHELSRQQVLIDEYNNCIKFNLKANGKKQKIYSSVIVLLTITIVVTILCFILKMFI